MLSPEIVSAVIAAAGAIIASSMAFLVGRKVALNEYNKEISAELWRERCKAYKALLKITDSFPQYPSRSKVANYEELKHCSFLLKCWYYEGGGLLLSGNSRKTYSRIQRIINEQILKNLKSKASQDFSIIIGDRIYGRVRKLMSGLRTELTNDLVSRKVNALK